MLSIGSAQLTFNQNDQHPVVNWLNNNARMSHKPWLIIGSTAAYHWYPDSRAPRDLDLLTPASINAPGVIDAQWHDAAEEIIRINEDPVFVDPNTLFTLKVSHAHWDVKWYKTMYDVHFFQKKGCVLNMDLYRKLFKVWETVHGKKRVNMSKPMTEFFKDAVHREFNHEELHWLVAFYDRPMHEVLRPDHGTAWCSEEKFNALTHDDQARCALEEIMVVAIERFNLRAADAPSTKRAAVSQAFFKLVTSMTTGWFARFLILHRNELLFERKDEWMRVLNKALSSLPATTQISS